MADSAGLSIRVAGPRDAEALADGLAALSVDLGDTHRMGADGLRDALCLPQPPFRAVLAGGLGLALYSPMFSTTQGGAGCYVSDLWVAGPARRTGLGRRLLAAAARDAEAIWGARFLSLSVYDHSGEARSAYDRLGFAPLEGQTRLLLGSHAFARLKGQT